MRKPVHVWKHEMCTVRYLLQNGDKKTILVPGAGFASGRCLHLPPSVSILLTRCDSEAGEGAWPGGASCRVRSWWMPIDLTSKQSVPLLPEKTKNKTNFSEILDVHVSHVNEAPPS